MNPLRKGWFRISGVQDGDRTIEQQLKGLDLAMDRARGCTILDLGAAEGLITREFILAGAASSLCVEIVEGNADEARRQLAGLPAEVLTANVDEFVEKNWAEAKAGRIRFDLVLALAILHKLKDPRRALQFIAMVTRGFAVIRTAERTPGLISDGRSGFRKVKVIKTLERGGMTFEQAVPGPHGEWTGYLRGQSGDR